jgi:hypothetical protein
MEPIKFDVITLWLYDNVDDKTGEKVLDEITERIDTMLEDIENEFGIFISSHE